MIADMPSTNSAKILDIVIEDDLKKEYKGLLALLAELGTMPVNLMEYIIKNNSVYGRVLNRIKMFTVCNTVGTAGEYLRLNAVIRDYILRTGFNMTEDIRKFLNKNTEEFAKRIEDPEYMNYLSFSEFSYYIKENLKKNISVPDKFLYATVYVKSIIELYNERKYSVIFARCNDSLLCHKISFFDCDHFLHCRFSWCTDRISHLYTGFHADRIINIFFKHR